MIMDILVLSIFTAIGYLLLSVKTLGLRRTIRWQVLLDIGFTAVLPMLFIGTFSGMMLAVLAGIFFTLGMIFITVAVMVVDFGTNRGAAQ